MWEPREEALVPPFATGRMPLTSEVRTAWAKEMVVPSVRSKRFAVPPVVREGTPDESVTKAPVLTDAVTESAPPPLP